MVEMKKTEGMKVMEDIFRAEGLNETDFEVYWTLLEMGGEGISSNIARRTGKKAPNIINSLKKLEEKEYVRKKDEKISVRDSGKIKKGRKTSVFEISKKSSEILEEWKSSIEKVKKEIEEKERDLKSVYMKMDNLPPFYILFDEVKKYSEIILIGKNLDELANFLKEENYGSIGSFLVFANPDDKEGYEKNKREIERNVKGKNINIEIKHIEFFPDIMFGLFKKVEKEKIRRKSFFLFPHVGKVLVNENENILEGYERILKKMYSEAKSDFQYPELFEFWINEN